MMPKEGFEFDTNWVIGRRIKLDHHIADNHPEQSWTPISFAMIRCEDDKHELAQVLLQNPHVQFDEHFRGPASDSADDPTSIVDVPWSAKVRKLMTYDADKCKQFENLTNQLLFVKHRDADTMWSLVVRCVCMDLVNYKLNRLLFSEDES